MSAHLPAGLQDTIRHKMARGEVVASMTVRLVRTPDIAYLAKTAGFDSLYVDMKHSPCSLDAAAQVCTAALHSGLTPLVRLATNTADEVSRVLDAGALGVIAPQIRTADEVREIVRAAKFQPIGERSVTGHLPQVMFDAVPDLMRVMNEATIVAINLETKDALDSVEEIAAVEGLDLLTIGTNDLTAELGIPGEYDNPIVRDAYRRVIAACNANGNHVGIGGLSRRSDLVEEFVRMGARYVSTGFDTMFLLAELRERAARVKQIQI